jgi:hypothetical protein
MLFAVSSFAADSAGDASNDNTFSPVKKYMTVENVQKFMALSFVPAGTFNHY